MDRFLRIERLLGPDRLQMLRNASVTIVGIGAVGGYAMEGLARSGLGHLRLVDFDIVKRHNINRQIIALEHTVGQKKVAAARERVLAINPECQVEALDIFAAPESMADILTPRPNLLIDAIDSLMPKVELLAAAYEAGIPIISSMGAALRTNPALITTADIMDTRLCPLAKRVRQRLRKKGIDRGITCVYSSEAVDFTYRDPDLEQPEEEIPEGRRGRKRRVLGSLPTLTGIFGLTIANLAISRLTAVTEEPSAPPQNEDDN